MKISLVCTVLNEEKTIRKFLDSVFLQSKLPNEVIIVDGGSTDNTVSEISTYKITRKTPKLKLIFKKGNISTGRNEGIKRASGDIILVSDAGCVLDKDWVNNIVKPFKDKKVDVSSGYYIPVAKNIFQKSLATYTSVMPDKIDKENFLPSSRSVAFRKKAWEKIKGYPEELDTCEDLIYDKKLKEKGFKFEFAENAVVYWPQRRNLKEAFRQFFRYAKGDGYARYFRPNTPFLFLRYIFALYILSLAVVMRSYLLNGFIVLTFLSYIAWSIKKNYKYIKDYKAFIFLPILQFTSDVAVVLGTTLGFLQSLSIKSIINPVRKNKFLLLIVLVYSSLMIYLIQWGIPNLNHPFNYAMDEWHFSQALRTFFKYGTGSISGAASIPLYHIVSSILFLVPFYILHIVNPLAIKNTLDNLPMQHTLFEILRLHTLFYGILSSIVIYDLLRKINKKYLGFFVAFFVFTPIFISLSNYYKYDVTLIFWILTSLLFLYKYFKTQEINNFIFSGIATGLAFSTKFTAGPLLIGYLLGYFLLSEKINYKKFLIAAFVPLSIFAFAGIPDLLLGKGNYYQLLYSTLVQGPKASSTFNLGVPSWFFLLFKEFPAIFGCFITYSFYISLVFWLLKFISSFNKKEFKYYRFELSIFAIAILFLLSTIFFSVDGGGNRALVLIPFFILIPALFVNKILSIRRYNKIIFFILLVGLLFQIIQSASWISVKFYQDPRDTSSQWILKNIPAKSQIGIENTPIYQMLPDFLLKEFYFKQRDEYLNTRYSYSVISAQSKNLPKYIVVTNDFENMSYIKDSSKKELVAKLGKMNYKRVKVFSPNLKYYNIFADERYFVLANIIAMPVAISIYEK